jgi:serine/threonine protein kinase
VFTHADVEWWVEEGNSLDRPISVGSVLMTTPQTFAQTMRAKLSRAAGIREPRLGRETIERVRDLVLGPVASPKPLTRNVGRYSYRNQPRERNEYFTLYEGHNTATGKRVWIKQFAITHLGRARAYGALAGQVLRGVNALEKLGPDPRLQQAFGSVEQDGNVFAILEPVDAPTLQQWLEQAPQPSRAERIGLLSQVAGTLSLLSRHEITHRALSPLTIRVRAGVPVLTDFDLCRIKGAATLPASGRRLFDRAYLAREADRPGDEVGPAADVYSLGRIACLVLAGALPCASYAEQGAWARKPGAFEQLAIDCGIADSEPLRRMLALDPAQRPTPSEILRWLQTW